MSPEQLKNILEAALMTSTGTMSLNRFVSLFEKDAVQPERADIRAALEQLQQDYESRGVELKEVASGFRFQVRNEYAQWVNRLFDERPQRYSRALLETLAIIAYRQPVTRGEIEDIRGVSISSSIIKTLQEREWIRVVGHRDVPGRPELLATTKLFLDYFNLKKLSDLPSLAEIKDFDKLNPDLFEGLEEEDPQQTDELDKTQDAIHVVTDLADNDEKDEPTASENGEVGAEQQSEGDVVAEAEAGGGTEDDESKMEIASSGNVVPFSN